MFSLFDIKRLIMVVLITVIGAVLVRVAMALWDKATEDDAVAKGCLWGFLITFLATMITLAIIALIVVFVKWVWVNF